MPHRTGMRKAQSIVGFSLHRSDADFYETPPEATRLLLEKESFGGVIWECASGSGSMSRVLETISTTISSDIRTGDDVYGERGIDFLQDQREVENIITNPPYGLATEFLLHAKTSARSKIALLCKLSFLEGIKRKSIFEDRAYPLKKVYVFSQRPHIHKPGMEGKSPMLAFAWFVWERSYKGEPTLGWI